MRRFFFASVLLAAALTVSTASAAPPPGATAKCRDGTYSYSRHHSGTCSHHGGVAKWLDGSQNRTTTRTGSTVLIGRRTRAGGCRRSVLPDRRCSPGGYYSKLARSVICAAGFHTGSIRDVPQSEKFAVEREYGMAATFYGHADEIDHIVPLELGGSNSIANLFFEPGTGKANYHVKDELENRAKEWVCDGRLSLGAARRGFARDWETLYRRLFGHAPGS